MKIKIIFNAFPFYKHLSEIYHKESYKIIKIKN